jgi:hypothetical protein
VDAELINKEILCFLLMQKLLAALNDLVSVEDNNYL